MTFDEFREQYRAAQQASAPAAPAAPAPSYQNYNSGYNQQGTTSPQSSGGGMTFEEFREKYRESQTPQYSVQQAAQQSNKGKSFLESAVQNTNTGTGKQNIFEKARSVIADIPVVKKQSDKQLEKLIKAYGNVTYDDTFLGQSKANFGAGKIAEAEAKAWSNFMDNRTDENRQKALELSQLLEDFRTRNATALDDENVKAGWLSKNIAGYLPQMGNQLKASIAPTAALTAGGFLLGAATPLPIADEAAGALLGYKAGRTVGTGMYSYENMRGYAFKNLLQNPNITEDQAKDAAEDEAIISSVLEMGDEAIEQFAKIPGVAKAFKKLGGDAVGTIVGSGIKKAAAEYLKNIGQEYSEEFLQEVVSIANSRRAENGDTDSGIPGLLNECKNVIANMASGALKGQVSDELSQAHEAGVGGGVIGAVMFPANAAVGGVMQNASNAVSNRIEETLNPGNAATAKAIDNELLSLSQNPTAEQHAIDAYKQYEDKLRPAKTGDVLVGADGKVYGNVTGHTRDGFVVTITDGTGGVATVPNGFLNNVALESVLKSGGEFMSRADYESRYADVIEAQQAEQDYGQAPFTTRPQGGAASNPASNTGMTETEARSRIDALNQRLQSMSQEQIDNLERELTRAMQNAPAGSPELKFLQRLTKVVIRHDKNFGTKVRNLMSSAQKQTSTSNDASPAPAASSTSSNSTDFAQRLTTMSTEDLRSLESDLYDQYYSGTAEQQAALDYQVKAVNAELARRVENGDLSYGQAGTIITDETTGGADNGTEGTRAVPVSGGNEGRPENGARQTESPGLDTSVQEGVRQADGTKGKAGVSFGIRGDQQRGVRPANGSSRQSVRSGNGSGTANGRQIEQRPQRGLGNLLKGFSNMSAIRFPGYQGEQVVGSRGANSIVSDADLTPEQRSRAAFIKACGVDEVYFFTDGVYMFNADGTIKADVSAGGAVVPLKDGRYAMILSTDNVDSVEFAKTQKHETLHRVEYSFYDANGDYDRVKTLNVLRQLVGDKNYTSAREKIENLYCSDYGKTKSERDSYLEKLKNNKPIDYSIVMDEIDRVVSGELFAQVLSGQDCYGALDRSYQTDAYQNEYLRGVVEGGVDAISAKDGSLSREEFLNYLEGDIDQMAPESRVSQVMREPTNDTAETENASTGDSEKLNNGSSSKESNKTALFERRAASDEQVDPVKRAQQSFGEHYNSAVKKNEQLSKLRTIAERPAPKGATKLEKMRAEQFQKGMKTLKDNVNKLVSGEMLPEDFADYYLGLNRSSDGMAAYYDNKTAERWINVQEAWKAVKDSPSPENVNAYRGELNRAMSQMTRSIERIDNGMRTLERLSESASKNKKSDTQSKNIFKKLARAYARWQINPTNVFRMIDGFDRNARGEGYRIQQRIDDAVADYQTLNVDAQANFAKVKQMKEFRDFASGKKMTNVKIGDTQLNMQQALSFIKTVDTLKATNPRKPYSVSGFALDLGDGKWKFVENRKVNINKVYNACVAALDDVAKAYKASADDALEMLGKRTMTTAEKINGFSPYVFEKGKYFPLWYKTSSDDGRTWSINHSIDGNLQEKRFTHERSNDNPGFLVISPITKVVDDYITQATNYAAFGELGSDLQLMNREENVNGSISQMMASNFGEDFAGWMKNYIDDVNEVIETDTEGINKILKEGRNMLAQGALLFSPSVQMKQVASYWSAAGVVKWDALKAAWRSKDIPMKGSGMQNPLLKYRTLGNVDPTISEALNSGLVKKLSSKSKIFNQIANMTNVKDIRTVDNVYTACVLDVAMDYPGMDKNSATFQKLVDQKFQEAVLNTQPIFTKQARAEYARTDNEIVRMLAMFRTQQTQNFNRLITAIGEYNAERKSGHVSTATTENFTQTIKGQINAAASFAALSIAADLLLHRTKKYRDEDGELDVSAFLERLGLNMVETSAATLWKMDDLAKWVIDKVSGGDTKEYYGMSLGPLSTVGDVVESIEYLIKTPSLSNLRYTVGYIGTLTGMPINNIYAMINSVAMYAKDLSGDNKEHFDDILKWTANENRPENQLIGAFTGGDTERANELFESIQAKATKSSSAESKVKEEVKKHIGLDELDHDDAVNLLLQYGGYDTVDEADKEVKIYELLHDEDINYNTLGQAYRDGDITKDQVMSARINIAGDTEEEAEQYVAKQDFQSKFGFSYTDMKTKYRTGQISASDAIEWRMKAGGVTRDSAEEWVKAQDVFLDTGYEYTSTGTASYYDSYATKETVGSNTFYDRHISEFPSKKAFGEVFNELDTGSKDKKFPTLTNRYGELGSKQTRVIFTLRDQIAKGNVSTYLAREIWNEYYGYSNYNWHFVTD